MMLSRPAGGDLEDPEARPTGVVASSWRRSEEFGLDPGHELNLPYDGERERASRLVRAAEPVLRRLREQLSESTTCVMLSDSKGWIVRRETSSSQLANRLDRITIVQGALASEEKAATNGLGTVLVERRPLVLRGADHFIESMQVFTCVGVPIVHPITGRLEGVLDFSCRVEDTNELLLPFITGAASEIEQRFYDLASSRERALFDAFVTRNRRTSHGVACLNEDVLFTNTRAAQLFDPNDHALLWDWASGVARSGRDASGVVTLSGDRSVNARAFLITDEAGAAGVLVTFAEARSKPAPSSVGRSRPGSSAVVPRWSGAWRRVLQAVQAARLTTGGVLLRGEPGTGKASLARTAWMSEGGDDESQSEFDCRARCTAASDWVVDAITAVEGGRAVLLRHVEGAVQDAAASFAQAVRQHPGARVVMTSTAHEVPTGWESLVDVVIDVPSLQERRTDIPVLVEQMIRDRVPADRRVRCTAPALSTLMRRDWPGNLVQLRRTVATALVNSMHSDITEQDLPADERRKDDRGSRTYTGLELAERDAIIKVLRSVGWKREAAADSLGISRATIYRKIRALGIKAPPPRIET
jgi:transcriptional regulator of acetoin/glycerol metabolism